MSAIHVEMHKSSSIGWLRGAARITFWGAIVMLSTALIGTLVGSPV